MEKIVLWIQDVLVPMLGPPGLFVVAFLDSSFLSLPEINDLLVVTGAASRPTLLWLYAAMTTGGSLLGCSVLWELGRRGGEAFLERRFGRQRVERTRGAFKRWDILALAIPAVLPPPMPFKIFVLSAGVFGIPFRRFLMTLLVARGFRYAFWGLMGAVYRDEARQLLAAVDRWFGARAPFLLAAVALAGLAGLAVYVVRRRRSAAQGAR